MLSVAEGILKIQMIGGKTDRLACRRICLDLRDGITGNGQADGRFFHAVITDQENRITLPGASGFFLLLDGPPGVHAEQKIVGQVIIIDIGFPVIDNGIGRRFLRGPALRTALRSCLRA